MLSNRASPYLALPRTTHMTKIYFATTLDQYDKPEYPTVLADVRGYFGPEAEILESRALWHSNDHWRGAWPGLLPTVDALAVWPRPDGTIGAGVYREVQDAREHGIPVHIFANADAAPARRFTMVPLMPAVGRPNFQRFGMIYPYKSRAKRSVARVGGDSDGS